jgi:hypothetical protein
MFEDNLFLTMKTKLLLVLKVLETQLNTYFLA